jgi:protein TilB
MFPKRIVYQAELRRLAAEKRAEKAAEAARNSTADAIADEKAPTTPTQNENEAGESLEQAASGEPEGDDRDQLTENTPEVREEIYRELAQQKKEKADREKANMPRERDYEKEQLDAITATRKTEQALEEKEIKQKNEGGWDFRWDEGNRQSFISLEVCIPRHLDSSLIDVDVHPSYISIIIKSKVSYSIDAVNVKTNFLQLIVTGLSSTLYYSCVHSL